MSSIPLRGSMMAVVLLGAGCGHGGGAIADALFNTGVALTSSAVSRSQGHCYAACPTGTTCNHATGYCDRLPCRGECGPHEQCVEDGLSSRCIAMSLPGGNVDVNPPTARPAP